MTTEVAPPPLNDDERVARASRALSHTFRDPGLLLRALTHKSLLNERFIDSGHNEVLELLGDAVLGLVAVEHLVRASPGADEGELTERRAAWVNEQALAARADVLGLAELLRAAKGIEGHAPLSARADLVEALIGAVYLDAGIEAARAATLHLLGEPPERVAAAVAHAKRVLQERLQRVFGEAPVYDVDKGTGPNHAPTFRAAVLFRGVRLGEGEGKNKKEATEAAAANAVTTLEIDDASLRERLTSTAKASKA